MDNKALFWHRSWFSFLFFFFVVRASGLAKAGGCLRMLIARLDSCCVASLSFPDTRDRGCASSAH